ncbi:MAG: hypothetical protein LUF91_06310 [Oscillospiraceae bacterium]|nr:hypothetical protein [Oscillospiraceae bacterium]
MDFKVEIKCLGCSCSAELRPVDFKARQDFLCPNCGRMLDHAVFAHLQSGISELAKVPDIFPESAECLSPGESAVPRFRFTVKEYSFDSEILNLN